jgi:hypothetical protein
MVNSRLISDPNFFIRSVVENNTNDVYENLKGYGYKGTKEPEDIIANIKQMVALGRKKEALKSLSVEFINKNINPTLKKELTTISEYRKNLKK